MATPVDHVVYRNRMEPRNWAFIILGFALAIVLILATQEIELLHAVIGVVAMLLLTLLIVIPIISWMGRRQVAELRVSGDRIALEMLSPFGRGRRIDIPVAETADWSVSKLWPTLRFRHGNMLFRLPLQGAMLDRDALIRIAPVIRQTPR